MTRLYPVGSAAKFPRIAKYEAVLSGDSASLKSLSQCFTEADCRVVAHPKVYRLLSSRLELTPVWKTKTSPFRDLVDEVDESEEEAEIIAGQLIYLMNGAAKLMLHSYYPIELDYIVCPERGGCHVKLSMSIAAHREPTDRETGVLRQWVRSGLSNDRIEMALQILGSQPSGWSNLYLIFELMKWDLGCSPADLGWISKHVEKRLTATANNCRTVEHGMRHASDVSLSRNVPEFLPLEEGRDIIKDLFRRWLDAKAP